MEYNTKRNYQQEASKTEKEASRLEHAAKQARKDIAAGRFNADGIQEHLHRIEITHSSE